MAKTFHRRKNLFRKRRANPLKIIITVLCCAGLVTGGYFGARFLMEGGLNPPASSGDTSSAASSPGGASSPDVSEGSRPDDSSETSSDPQPPEPSDGTVTRAFYLPVSVLRDTAALDETLEQAAAAGFDAVLFDLKDEEGRLYYVSATELAIAGGGITEDALTLDELKAAAQAMQAKGFTPVPRLFAFRDNTASKKLHAAKITVRDQPSWTWYDADPDNGGHSWLNPYAPEAHSYIAGLVGELGDAGFTAVMLDGVQFPEQTKSAYYGTSEWTSMSQGEILKKFVTDLTTAQPDMQIMLSAPGLAVFGNDTKAFGANPVTFGAPVISPVLIPSTLGSRLTAEDETVDSPASHPYDAVRLAAGQILQRIRMMPADEQPALLPWIDGSGSAADAKEQMRALTELMGSDAAFILYHADGRYDFSALAA